MCCLFGILDYKLNLTLKDRQNILRVLSTECEERGTDATGIAYYVNDRLTIQKAPKPAHKFKFKLAAQAHFIIGHTRMTTQGNEKRNYNNHPFVGHNGGYSFALAHNGMIYNDHELRQEHHLPTPKIETDSYIAVQLLEQDRDLSFDSLAKMSGALCGSFCFTVLTQEGIYFVKGNNPMCIVNFPALGFYLYASTSDILSRAMTLLKLNEQGFSVLPIAEGEIVRISLDGSVARGKFHNSHILSGYGNLFYGWDDWEFGIPAISRGPEMYAATEEGDYLEELMEFAEFSGLDRNNLELLIENGFGPMEIEEIVYDPDLLEVYLDEILCDQRVRKEND